MNSKYEYFPLLFYFGVNWNEENFKQSIKCKNCVFHIALFDFCSFVYCSVNDKNAFILD